MAVTTIPWGDGSGDNIYLTYPSASGDQTVTVTSDANTGSARSKVVTFTSGVGNITQQLTVNQAAGGPQYVTDGLVFWLDGIDKGGTTAWVEKINNYSFENHGATFNTDHVYFDGVDDYMSSSGAATYANSANIYTIEVVYEKEANGIIYQPKSGRYMIAFGFNADGRVIWQSGRGQRPLYNAPSSGSASISAERAIANGTAMTSTGTSYISRADSSSYIGRRNAADGDYFKGKVFSIRIYNRNLSEAEVLANLAVDNQRFNLGLTI